MMVKDMTKQLQKLNFKLKWSLTNFDELISLGDGVLGTVLVVTASHLGAFETLSSHKIISGTEGKSQLLLSKLL